jgi:NADH-quinone oxidoreductase subunit D
MEFYEQACGARLHAAYIRPGGVFQEEKGISKSLLNSILEFTIKFPTRLNNLETMLTNNRI